MYIYIYISITSLAFNLIVICLFSSNCQAIVPPKNRFDIKKNTQLSDAETCVSIKKRY